MGRYKESRSSLMRGCISEYNSRHIFTIDGKKIYCQACKKSYPWIQKSQVDQHARRVLHRKNEARLTREKTRQQLLTQAAGGLNDYFYELTEAFVAAGIPWKKLKNPKLRSCLEKYTNRTLPEESTLRKNYQPQVYKDVLEKIQTDIGDAPIYLQIDETTDKMGRYIANILVGALRENSAGRAHLIHVKQLDVTNNSTITQTVLESLEILWPKNTQSQFAQKLLLFLTDGAAYMVKAGKNLRRTYPRMIHLTCAVHALHRLAEKIRFTFKKVDKLISATKKVFCKAPSRVVAFKERFPSLSLPPKPVLVRWGTWIEAAMYYAENLESIVEILNSFDPNKAACIPAAQKACTASRLSEDLEVISSNYGFLVGSIKKLETKGLSLEESVGEIESVLHRLQGLDGEKHAAILLKMETLLAKNKGFPVFQTIKAFFQGNATSEAVGMDAGVISSFRFSPITTVDTERSFSEYKAF